MKKLAHGLALLFSVVMLLTYAIPAFAQEGETAFDRLRGMYAFCLIGCDGRTWLVRDPFGIKPLYYVDLPGRFLFASDGAAAVERRLGMRLGLNGCHVSGRAQFKAPLMPAIASMAITVPVPA